MKILIVAAHPDDEILGVGGTILKHKEKGDEVFVCMVTKGYKPEWSEEFIKTKLIEAKKVDNLLGIKKRFFCDFPTVKLNTIPHGKINEKISEIIKKIDPNIVYTHFEKDVNRDHGIIFNAIMVATRPINKKKIKVICFETLSSSEWNHESFSPNFYVDIGKFIKRKIEAFSIYKSEVKKYPHPRSREGIEILAKKRGMEISLPYAEAFIIVRDFW